MADERKVIVARVSQEMHQRVKVAAAKAGVSVADFIIDAVTTKMSEREKISEKS